MFDQLLTLIPAPWLAGIAGVGGLSLYFSEHLGKLKGLVPAFKAKEPTEREKAHKALDDYLDTAGAQAAGFATQHMVHLKLELGRPK